MKRWNAKYDWSATSESWREKMCLGWVFSGSTVPRCLVTVVSEINLNNYITSLSHSSRTLKITSHSSCTPASCTYCFHVYTLSYTYIIKRRWRNKWGQGLIFSRDWFHLVEIKHIIIYSISNISKKQVAEWNFHSFVAVPEANSPFTLLASAVAS